MSNDTMPCGCEGHADNVGLCRYPALVKEADNYHRALSTALGEVSQLREQLTTERQRREEAEAELARVRSLPELEWAQAAAAIAQGLALHACSDQPAAARMADALDRAKTYVDRLRASAEKAKKERDEALRSWQDASGCINPDTLWAALREIGRLADKTPTEGIPDAIRRLASRVEFADNAMLLEAYRRTWSCVQHDNVLHSPACNASKDELGLCTPECPALYVATLLKVDHPGAALLERVRVLEGALGEISTACEDKGLRNLDPTDANTMRKLVRVIDTAWSTARDALKERKQ